MKIGGWLRLWIVLTVLYGLLLAPFAYVERPTLARYQSDWVYDVADMVAKRLSQDTIEKVSHYKIRDRWREKGTDAETIEEFEKLVRDPTEKQKPYADEVRRLNEKHRALIADLPNKQLRHFLIFAAWWIGPALALLVFGWSIGWVVRGFR